MSQKTLLSILLPLIAAAQQSTLAISPSSPSPTPDPSGTQAVLSAAATASTSSQTSSVKGKSFDRFVQIWLENTDYDKAFGDPNMQKLAKEGITLTNYYALTHLSEPNYVGAVGGDYFGIYNDDVHRVPSNISTVVDLLDSRGISWAEYQENMPYTGYEPGGYRDPHDGYTYYVRKHNPLVMYDSIALNSSRLSNIKNDTLFQSDLSSDSLPQWLFITPNMKNDGHDTSITYAAKWTYNFLTPLLTNKNFMKNTLVLLTFDESHAYNIPNHVFSLLLGDAIPEKLKGTVDGMFYTHYSALSTVEANWGLPHLGRGDVEKPGNNVFQFVADAVGWKNTDVEGGKYPDNNKSKPGPFNTPRSWAPWPTPDLKAVGAGGRGVLERVAEQYGTTPAPPVATKTVGASASASASGTVKSGSGRVRGSVGMVVGGFTAVIFGLAVL